MAKAERPCECAFCNSKCPECGSLDVSVAFTPRMTYDNRYENRLILKPESIRSLQMKCRKCGAVSSGKKLNLLKDALKATLHFCALHKPNGKVVIQDVPRTVAVRTTEIEKDRNVDPVILAMLNRKKERDISQKGGK